MKKKVILLKTQDGLLGTVRRAMAEVGILDRLSPTSRVTLKPNLTYPYYNPGVTTSPEVIRLTVQILREITRHIAIVETGGGYGAWAAEASFEGHNLYDIAKEFEVDVVDLCTEPSENIQFISRGRRHALPLPVRLLHETDTFITMPVPKIHAMTGLTLAYKNQWGCVPDLMRLRRHYIFDDAIVAINKALKPAVLADGTYFLNRHGPMEGDPVRMDMVLAATDAGSFDRYVSELMGIPWRNIKHLRRAVALGDMPTSLDEIECNVQPSAVSMPRFALQRSLRNYIALAGFKSRLLTWLGYESWFGKVILHSILYAIAGKPVKPEQPGPSAIASKRHGCGH